MRSIPEFENHVKLKDYGKNNAVWDKHKQSNNQVAQLVAKYDDSPRAKKNVEYLNNCAGYISFAWYDVGEDKPKFNLVQASFCRKRMCPLCAWRRSLMLKARFCKNIFDVMDKYPKARYIFLTLTVQNVPVSELRTTLKEMNIAFKRMYQLDVMKKYVLGFVRNVEVTRDKTVSDYCHPHFHIIIMVKSTYFQSGYINQEQFTEIWKQCLRVTYKPIVYVKTVRSSADKSFVVKEMFKYCVKESDIQFDKWYLDVMKQLHRTRSISTSGALKDIVKDLTDNDKSDMIHINDVELSKRLSENINFQWVRPKREYRQV